MVTACTLLLSCFFIKKLSSFLGTKSDFAEGKLESEAFQSDTGKQ
jgi:hypothetical protein